MIRRHTLAALLTVVVAAPLSAQDAEPIRMSLSDALEFVVCP